jgi:hypothetical protein
MQECVLFEYRARLTNVPDIEADELARTRRGIIWIHVRRGKPIHCVIKLNINSEDGSRRAHGDLEREAEDLVLFALDPGPHRRISHSTLREVNEERLRELGPVSGFHVVNGTEICFYSS